ncbi:unnamed protein product [Musa acuminata subsp. malaccensis]|uniref:(wild Malaysian banana) hypothetical protein n=1 Tax=Musa acuminata subsp. malaccensis TaxID=214687 RepID=A0A8D7B6J3_MUSAM|nr:unnamed protein product [Musa acuminata subsp. malaccensis]
MSFSARLYHPEMEKEAFWGLNWQSTDAKVPPELNSGTAAAALLPQRLLNLNWNQPMSCDAGFESALSSAVVGQTGSICNSGEISPSSRRRGASNSCYSSPLNSPPKLNGRGALPMPINPMPGAHSVPFAAEPWFADGAAMLSNYGGGSSAGFPGQFGLPVIPANLSRVSSSKSLKTGTGSGMGAPEKGSDAGMLGPARMEMEMMSKLGGSSTPADSEPGNGQEESSVSSLRGVTDSNARKRKAAAKGKGKEASLSYAATDPFTMTEEENSDAKRSKPAEANGKMKTEQNGDPGRKQPPEPPKDYIHVRARRGQATDAHSLAERVRREKISKRMKFLQDLVPGCNKVTGKAVMLDEIINYVQSLQRQVEFLSMKLATLNPQLDDMESILSKDMFQARGLMPQPVYPAEMTSAAVSNVHQPQATPGQSIVTSLLEAQFSLNPLESSLHQSQSLQLVPLDGFTVASSQLGEFWEDDLQSVAQVGYGRDQKPAFSSQSYPGKRNGTPIFD